MNAPHTGASASAADELLAYRLSLRLGAIHARQRQAIEEATEARALGRDGRRLHLENLTSAPGLIRACLRLSGLWRRGQANSLKLRTREHALRIASLPAAFEGFRILHLTDLHVDMDDANLSRVIDTIKPLDYDLCVLTGDYRSLTWGPVEAALSGMARLREAIRGEPLAILGNHDSIRMLPALEDMGYRLLMNEHQRVDRGDASFYVAGVDDPHLYKVHNLQRAADSIPAGATSLLLSHSPEIWKEAAYAGFDAYLCGHTHGGQICLPGGLPLTLDADCPRALGNGAWHFAGMQGYTSPGAGTSVVNVRLNCPPEVTLHTLTRGPD